MVMVTGVLLWLVRGSGIDYRLHCVTLTVSTCIGLQLQRAVEDLFVLVTAAAHSNRVFSARYKILLLTYFKQL